MVAWLRTIPVHISPKYQIAQVMRGPAGHVTLNSRPTQSLLHTAHARRRRRQSRVAEPGPASIGTASPALREQAQQATKAITTSLRYRIVYGFYPGHDYKLAVQTAGELPVISADQVPPHFQQYVIVEVTIDTEGRVAEARIVAGIVDPAIEQTLLTAIKDFKYVPAKRDGVPIPSQRDIVIHVPS